MSRPTLPKFIAANARRKPRRRCCTGLRATLVRTARLRRSRALVIFVLEAVPWLVFVLDRQRGGTGRRNQGGMEPALSAHGVFAALIVAQLAFRVTAYPHDTASLALQYFAYAMLCFLTGQTLLRGAQAREPGAHFLGLTEPALAGFALRRHLLERQTLLDAPSRAVEAGSMVPT